jgi:hypothetical protein
MEGQISHRNTLSEGGAGVSGAEQSLVDNGFSGDPKQKPTDGEKEQEVEDNAFAERIRRLYIDEHFPGSGQSLTAFYRQLKQTGRNEGRSFQTVQSIIRKYPAYIQQVPAKVHFPTRHITSLGSGLQCQIDLAEFPPSPRGSKYVMLMIDVFSQMYYGKCLEDKNSSTTAKALADLLEENPFPLAANLTSIGADWGGEFQAEFAQLCERRHIRLFYYRGRSKAAMAEHGTFSKVI